VRLHKNHWQFSRDSRIFQVSAAELEKIFFFRLTVALARLVSGSSSELIVAPVDMVKLWCNRLQVPVFAGIRFFWTCRTRPRVLLVIRASGGAAQSSDGPQTGSTRSETEEAVEAALSFCLVHPCMSVRAGGSQDAAP
jgi:hypothetical protein